MEPVIDQEQPDAGTLVADAMPTKRLFIEMLVKDVDLIDAINDLIDNSIDGAKRSRPSGNYNGLSVQVRMSQTEFALIDNCGGIPLDVAQDYAFKFGRPFGANSTLHSVGRFGIGMKRAMFKMGRDIRIDTTSAQHRYSVLINIDEWSREDGPTSWHFPITLHEQGDFAEDLRGTTITITNLYDEVARRFALDDYATTFQTKLKSAQNEFLAKGLALRVNQKSWLTADTQKMRSSDLLKPASWSTSINPDDSGDVVNVQFYAGLGGPKESPDLAGWYIFCNGRLIMRADRSTTVGWGTEGIPRYHNQYSAFRGYAFFDCDNSDKLPWNTTKTALDTESPVYLQAFPEMRRLTKEVVEFINALDAEKDAVEQPLTDVVSRTTLTPLEQLAPVYSFESPEPQSYTSVTRLVRISFQKTEDEVDEVRDQLVNLQILHRTASNKDVGLAIFKYFVENEC